MSFFRVVSLYSGSGGNSTLVETKKGALLIDAGKSARSLCAALKQSGSDPAGIDAVFVTHEHTDHISALEVLTKKHRIPVHITAASAAHMRISEGSALNLCMKRHTPLYTERVADMTVSSFLLSHDSAMCVGYRIETDDGFCFGVATDTGYVTDGMIAGLTGCDAVMLESNHSIEMLRVGPYPAELKRRILSKHGHLSNDDCASFIGELALQGCSDFLLAHISRENNLPSEAMRAAESALNAFPNARLLYAKPDVETNFVSINS